MQRKQVLKSVVLVVMMSMTLGLGHIASAQAPEDDVFAVVKISNPGTLLPAIGGLVDKFQPGMGGMIDPMMVGNMAFNNPEWTGMDMAGDYTAVILNPMKYGGAPFGIIVPLTAKDDYLAALSQSLTGGEDTDGIYSFVLPNQKNLFVAPSDSAGVLSESTEVAALVKSLVDGNSPVLSEVPVVKGQITASLATNKILAAVQPMVDMVKQQLLMGMQQGMPEGEDASNPAGAMAEIAETEFDVALSLLNQTEKVQLGISLEDAGLRLSKAVFAVNDSDLATFMGAQSPKKSTLLDVIPSDSALLMSGSIEITPELQEGYLGLFEMMASLDEETDDETLKTLLQWAESAFEAFGGDFAAGMLSPTSDTLVTEVLSLKDAELAKELIAQYPAMLDSMVGVYEEMGVDFKMNLAETTEVKGGEVMQFQSNFNADMIPDPDGQEVFKTLFGETLDLPIGFSGNYAVAGFGKDAREQVAGIMEMLDSGAETSAEHNPASFGLPEENNMFVYLSVPKILSWAAAKNLPDVPPFELVEGPGLAMAGRFVESRFEGELYLPIEEILAIKQIAEQAQGQAGPPAE
ncbi:MAG: hypothetical protein GY801_35650 [bacterium]|nr:hypothetical protein [bacterium]